MTSAQPPTSAHTATVDAVALALDVRVDVGLGHQRGVERLAKWGPNALPVTPPRSPWRVLLAQFKSVMIVILLGAALLAAWVGSVKDASVILLPGNKVAIVRALQAKGHVVAMTGDGVNGAPALKQADIGVAMGVAGTAVAKEAATMVLTDDNFATIVTAVRHGRTLYDNILKFVRFQLSTTMGAILTVFTAPLLGMPEPFTSLQILWVAIIMDGPPAVSLSLDAASPGIMDEPPRRRGEPVLPLKRVARVFAYGATMTIGTLGVLHHGLQTGPQDRALTMSFTTFVLFQLFNVLNARNESGSAFNAQFFSNRMLWMSLGAALLLQMVATQWGPATRLFGTTGMAWADWVIASGVASSVLLLEEARKWGLRGWRHFRAEPEAQALAAPAP